LDGGGIKMARFGLIGLDWNLACKKQEGTEETAKEKMSLLRGLSI
jgi:hypothetical protein